MEGEQQANQTNEKSINKEEENKIEKKEESTQNENTIKSTEEDLPTYKLNSTWTFYYASRKESDRQTPYNERLTKIAEFSTMKDFLHYYIYMKPVNQISRDIDIAIFKQGYKPLWECCPDSGCWLLRFKRTADLKDINIKWEKVVFSLVCEQFDEPNMLGAVLSIRGRETIIQIWFNYFKYEKIKNAIALKFGKLIIGEQGDNSGSTLYFKDSNQSMIDKSTLRNTETYSFKKKRKFTYK